MALSVTEAEYVAGCEGATDAAWIRQFLEEITSSTTPILTIIMDSEGALNLSKTAKFQRRS